MLAVASAFEPKTNLETLAARARHARRNLSTATVSALTKGLGALRATSGAPGVLAAEDDEDGPSALIRPAESGMGLLAQFSAQVNQVSPLTAGIGGRARSGTTRSLGILQSQMVRSRQDFTRIDNQSRRMQATSRPSRGTTGFAAHLLTSTVDLVV